MCNIFIQQENKMVAFGSFLQDNKHCRQSMLTPLFLKYVGNYLISRFKFTKELGQDLIDPNLRRRLEISNIWRDWKENILKILRENEPQGVLHDKQKRWRLVPLVYLWTSVKLHTNAFIVQKLFASEKFVRLAPLSVFSKRKDNILDIHISLYLY